MDSLLLALRALVGLGAVIAVIWFLRRRNSSAGKDRRARKPLSVVARQNLAAKVSVAVVDFGGKRFLLGVSEHGVTVLHDSELEPVEETVDEPLEGRRAMPDGYSSAEFAQTLSAAEQVAASGVPTPVRLVRDPAIDAAFAASSSHLAGSLLSAATWKQAWSAIRTGR
ncbi:MAG: flagellar biosynthetic protein FliO [Acidobacteria bacterium]|nr:flagellar biosynthetic protein FliO [Acidobacteriota bacterium]